MSPPARFTRTPRWAMLARMGFARRPAFWLADSGAGERLLRRLPGGEALAWRRASRYVAGRTRAEALTTAVGLLGGGHGVSLDLAGERLTEAAEAGRVAAEYVTLAGALHDLPDRGRAWLSADLTHLGLDVDPAGAAERVATIAGALPAGSRLQVGAEDAARTDPVLRCLRAVTETAPALAARLGATLPANAERSPDDLELLADLGLHVRLVKGAYVERTGTHPYGEATDLAYLRLAHRLAERRAAWAMATHDNRLREALLLSVGPVGPVTVEQLLGVHPETLGELYARGVPTRVYVPYGPGWPRYWLRRVAESRGA